MRDENSNSTLDDDFLLQEDDDKNITYEEGVVSKDRGRAAVNGNVGG